MRPLDTDSAIRPSLSPQQQRDRETTRWLVYNALAGGVPCKLAAQAAHATGVKLIPWVGVAAPLLVSDGSETTTSSPLPAEEGGAGRGAAFCFLPLPLRTGLPVHVNAFFELSSNRRDIWYAMYTRSYTASSSARPV
jgi:sacsin